MYEWNRGRRAIVAVLAAVVVLVLAACGSSSSGSSDAASLLQQTFNGVHNVGSGKLNVAITVVPSGSSTLTKPIGISFGGPFQSLGGGQLPKSDFTITISSGGHASTLGLLSTGTAGYINFHGSSYQLPSATFRQLQSSFSSLASSPGASNSGALAKLGIQPLHWLESPSVVGSETVSGAHTTHIHAGVNVPALLADLNTFLKKASSLGISNAAGLGSGLSSAIVSQLASEVKNPTLDVWTGTADKTLRKLTINLTLAPSGQFSTALGGLRSAQVGVTMLYSDLNQPQTIAAPTNVRPFSSFASTLQSLLGSVGGLAGAAGGSSSSRSSSAGGASVQSYSQCINSAHGDITKMQRCASLING